MKISREQAARHREQILDVATRLFLERGLEGIGVAELMAAAGFTHGGFYGHFSSKEELIDQCCARAFTEKVEMWRAEFVSCQGRPLRAMVKRYLTPKHRQDPGTGCPLASWAVDASRQPRSIRRTFTDGLRRLVKIVSSELSGKSKREPDREALATWSTLVGAMVLARAVDDPRLADEILRSAARRLQATE